MSDGVAYVSSGPEALEAWEAAKKHTAEQEAARAAMAERFGRRLMVNRAGFGHGTRVTGFEVLDGEQLGDVLGENGELRIPKTGSTHVAGPNLRRKAGKELERELSGLTIKGPELPGMPSWVFSGSGVHSPAIFEHDGAVFVRWAAEVEPTDPSFWERIPLSQWYAEQEDLLAERAAETEAGS